MMNAIEKEESAALDKKTNQRGENSPFLL